MNTWIVSRQQLELALLFTTFTSNRCQMKKDSPWRLDTRPPYRYRRYNTKSTPWNSSAYAQKSKFTGIVSFKQFVSLPLTVDDWNSETNLRSWYRNICARWREISVFSKGNIIMHSYIIIMMHKDHNMSNHRVIFFKQCPLLSSYFLSFSQMARSTKRKALTISNHYRAVLRNVFRTKLSASVAVLAHSFSWTWILVLLTIKQKVEQMRLPPRFQYLYLVVACFI